MDRLPKPVTEKPFTKKADKASFIVTYDEARDQTEGSAIEEINDVVSAISPFSCKVNLCTHVLRAALFLVSTDEKSKVEASRQSKELFIKKALTA